MYFHDLLDFSIDDSSMVKARHVHVERAWEVHAGECDAIPEPTVMQSSVTLQPHLSNSHPK